MPRWRRRALQRGAAAGRLVESATRLVESATRLVESGARLAESAAWLAEFVAGEDPPQTHFAPVP